MKKLLVLILLALALAAPSFAAEIIGTEYGHLSRFIVSSEDFEDVVQAKFYDPSGNETIYDFAVPARINGTRCKNVDAVYNALKSGVYCSFTLDEDGKISVLSYEESGTAFENVTYSAVSGFSEESANGNGIFYKYGDDFFSPEPFLNENYVYSITVYGNTATVINSFTSKKYDAVFYSVTEEIDMSSDLASKNAYIEAEFSAESLPSTVEALVTLYDENKNAVSKPASDIHRNTFCFYIYGLPNKTAKYFAEISLSNQGVTLADPITVPISVTETEIKSGYLNRFIVSSEDFEDVVKAEFYDLSGNIVYYDFAFYATINGRRYRTVKDYFYEAISSALESGTYYRFALDEDGKINVASSAPFTASTAQRLANGTEIATEIYNLEAGGDIIVAGYNGSVLKAAKIIGINETDKSVVFDNSVKSVRVFVWDMQTLIPITPIEEIKIN